MLKGVSRNVIEVVDTGSELFERAILFVRPAGRECDPAHLEGCARGFLAGARVRRKALRAKSVLGVALRYILAAALGAGLAAALLVYF